jgi:deoxyribonuclease V
LFEIMKITSHHSWSLTPAEAVAVQEQLRAQVITTDQLGSVRFVAGVDVGYDAESNQAQAAVAVLNFPDLQLQAHALTSRSVTFPYVPGLLSFREVPVALDALEQLTMTPDLLLCDGQGFAHPRRFGLACHLGVLTDIPSIGVAKTRFIGDHEAVPVERGAWQPLTHDGEVVGAVLRTRTGINPVYVSIGHRISLPTAIDYVLRCAPRYRLPETTRWADHLSRQQFSSTNANSQ